MVVKLEIIVLSELHEEVCLAEVVGIGAQSECSGGQCLAVRLQLLEGE